ncbi:hypothetical protein P7K49_005544, partial [Saguinus oedipus]
QSSSAQLGTKAEKSRYLQEGGSGQDILDVKIISEAGEWMGLFLESGQSEGSRQIWILDNTQVTAGADRCGKHSSKRRPEM